MAHQNEDSIRNGNDCPVSGLPVHHDPAWEMGDADTKYRVKFYRIGDNILFSDPIGYAGAQDTIKSLELCQRVEAFILSSKDHYVQIENFKGLSRFSLGARRVFIQHFENRPKVHGLIFYGVSTVEALGLKLTAKMAARMYKDHFPIKIVKTYKEAIASALEMLAERKSLGDDTVDDNSLADTESDKPVHSEISDAVTDQYVEDILRYLGNLNFESGSPEEYQPVRHPETHPFFQVFEHIDMINNDVNNLIQRWIQDTKEKEELQKKLALSQKMEALGLLAGSVAHDLNNVLSGLTTYPEILLMDLPEKHSMRTPLLRIQESGEKASTIVQDLLTLARRGAGKLQVINLNQVIKAFLKSPENRNTRKKYPDLKIVMETNPNLPNIMGSEIHLMKATMNLVLNAAEAQENLDRKNIMIRTDHKIFESGYKGFMDIPAGEYAILDIFDQGVGIESKDLDRIFEPFYSTKKMGRSGTGLGMAVVWGTVEDHKAFIDIKTGKDSGTCFSLFFPVTKEEMADEKDPSAPKLLQGNGETVLVIDDVESQREIAKSILERLGYGVEIARSGEEAIAYLKKRDADLILLDMIMEPGIDGYETYERILAFKPDQKAIVVSGFTEMDMVKKIKEIGARQYIRKPYNVENISKAVYDELHRV